MTLMKASINSRPNFIMETQLMDDFDSSFLYEWKTAEEDLDFLDYTYCFEVDNPNKRSASKATATTTLLSTECRKNTDEKQTVLNISLEKLRRIEDPESCLRRTVLISNTIRRIRSRKSSELKMLHKDNETAGSCCFTCTLPCKRPRLHVTDLINSNATLDNLKGDYIDYQGLITKQDCKRVKEICNQRPIPAGSTLSQLPLTLNTTSDETKRNCDLVRFNGLELPTVICALET